MTAVATLTAADLELHVRLREIDWQLSRFLRDAVYDWDIAGDEARREIDPAVVKRRDAVVPRDQYAARLRVAHQDVA